MKSLVKKISSFVLILPFAIGCKILEVDPVIMTEDEFYDSQEDAQMALNAVYGVLNSWQLYGCNYIMDLNYNSDICTYMSISNDSMKGACFELNANCDDVYQVWTWLYKGINNANAFLQKIVTTEYDTDGSMAAQARFLRAYYYFLLAQNYLNVPLKTQTTESYLDVSCPPTDQYDVMKWAVSEIEAAIPYLTEDLSHAPSDVTKTTAQGILARFYLYMAGEGVEAATADERHEYYGKCAACCDSVIQSGRHSLNPNYEEIFSNMVADKYDHTYYESMWEADFLGDRTSADYWGNGRWGELNGIRSSNMDPNDYTHNNANFAYGLFCNTIKLWDLYMTEDRVKLEKDLATVTDIRQNWNIPPFHYNGTTYSFLYPYGGDPTDKRALIAGVDRAPYCASPTTSTTSTNDMETHYPAGRYVGKFRREVQYEGLKTFKALWNGVNVPILRYADILLMYAEAKNEYDGKPTSEIYDMVTQIRDRAGIQSDSFSKYSTHDKFAQLIQNERAREFAFEGLRKHDLIRWGIYLESLQEVSLQATTDSRWAGTSSANNYIILVSRASERYTYLPIPALELAVNKQMKQNSLW